MLALSRAMNDPRLEVFAAQVQIDVALERTAADRRRARADGGERKLVLVS